MQIEIKKKKSIIKKIFPYKIVNKKRFCLFVLDIILLFSLIISSFHPGAWNLFSKKVNQISESELIEPIKKASAAGLFAPTAGTLIRGTEQTITSATAASSNGVNVGSWKGTLADDNFHWVIASTASGYDVNLSVGGVQLNGANTLIIQTEFDLDATVPGTVVQICDWVSASGKDNDADTECTGGGWRTLNLAKAAITSATVNAYQYQIYDGYFSDGSNTAYSTPLTNFLNSNEIKIRYYSETNTTSVVAIDFLRIFAVINPVYTASGFTNNNALGSVTGDYRNTEIGVGQTGSDDNRNGASGDASSVADFHWSFKNVETYTGMNTILVRSEHSCSSTNAGVTYRPKIYNFTTASWEDLTTGDITCSTTDSNPASVWAKNNITIADYIDEASDDEMRIGFYGLVNSTITIRADYIYAMVGTTNTDTGDCEITFGNNSANDCANTRDIDTTGTSNTWNIATEDESTSFGKNYYPRDNDTDATVEEAAASHVKFDVTQPANTAVTGVFYAARIMSGTGGTVTASLKDYSGVNGTYGGFTDIGGTATTSLTYTDNLTVSSIASAVGSAGIMNNPYGYINTNANEMWMRLRTSTDGATTNNSINQFDFAFVTLQWVEDSTHPTKTFQFLPTDGDLIAGTEQTVTSATAASAEGTNVGSWRGTMYSDDFHWVVASTASGYNMNFTFANAALNGANSILIDSEIDFDSTAPSTYPQICDWSSLTNVDAAADTECTGGGWRTLTPAKTAATSTTERRYVFQIYDGYWSDGSNTAISTPLTNFINGSNEIRIRLYSATNTTSQVSVDYIRVSPQIYPIYGPAGFTNSGSGASSGDYTQAQIGNFSSGSISGSDDARNGAAGTAATVADFYWSFKNVETYTGMNTILVRAEHSCSAAGITYRPKIYNFTTTSWEDLTTGGISCSTTDFYGIWAKNNVTITDYVSSGEIRVGFYGLVNSTSIIRADFIYVMLGTTNTSSVDCEISFGSGTETDCDHTRDIDANGTVNTWDITKETESTDFSHDYYALDTNGDVNVENGAAAHVKFSVTSPAGQIAGVYSAYSYIAGAAYSISASGYIANSVRDYSGYTGTTGGFHPGATATYSATYTLNYYDNISMPLVSSGGQLGMNLNPESFIDFANNEVWYRSRIYGAAVGSNLTSMWDFAMVSLGWVE